MKRFRSVALDAQGRKYAGNFEAENEAEALSMLHSQGFQVLSLEEIVEPEVEVEDPAALKAKARIIRKKNNAPPPTNEVTKAGFSMSGGRLGGGFWKTLALAALVLGGIPLTVYVFMPRPPLNTPEEAARAYFEYEIAGDYAGQYSLFSSGRLMLAGSRETYIQKRTADARRLRPPPAEPEEGQEKDALANTADAAPVLAGVEKRSDDGREAEAAAFIVRSLIHEEYAVKLLLEERTWKIREVKFVKRKELGKPKSAETQDEEAAAVEPAPEKKAESKPAPAKSGLAQEPEQETAPEGSQKPNISAAKEQALGLLEEARDTGVITAKEFQERKKQMGL